MLDAFKNIGSKGKDPLVRGAYELVDPAPHGRSASTSQRGESASLAGRQSPSAEPSTSAAAGR